MDGIDQVLREAIGKAPFIAAITINSHLAGDPFRFLKVISGQLASKSGKSTSQDQLYQQCTLYIGALKKHGYPFARVWAERLTSKDPLVAALLKQCRQEQYPQPFTWWEKLKFKLFTIKPKVMYL